MSSLLKIVPGLLTSSVLHAGPWPQFRGSTGQGLTSEKNLPLTWNAATGENIAWKKSLPSGDSQYSSPIVSGDNVIVTCVKNSPLEHRVLCFAARDGALRWETSVQPGPLVLTDLRGGYGAPTPCTDGQRIVVVFGSAVIAAIGFDGKLQWRQEIQPHAFDVAMGSSPVIYQDTVILNCDQTGQTSCFLAWETATGNLRWEAKRPDTGFAHSTPVLVEIGGRKQFLTCATKALQSLDPANGKVLWWCDAQGDAASPVFAEGLIFCDSGRGGPGIALTPGTEGNVTSTNVKWSVPQISEGLSSPVIVGSRVYRTHGPGILVSFNLQTGQRVLNGRLAGVSTYASPIATPDGRIYFVSAGKSYVIKAGDALEILGSSDLGEDSRASAAVSDGRIFVRGDKSIYCISETAKAAATTTTSNVAGGQWENISDAVTKDLKPGYGGPTAGVAVDSAGGAVFLVISDLGMWRSQDHGGSFSRCDDKAIGGRAETGWALNCNPAGAGMACFMIYGDSASTTDCGNTWSKWKTSHLDFGAVDWADTGKRLLAIRHESGGMLTTSADGGATWQDLGKGFSGCGVVRREIFLATKEKEQGIFRSADAGGTWQQVFPDTPTAPVPVVHQQTLWWSAGKNLLSSKDQGLTWQPAQPAIEASYGPCFDTAEHFVIVNKAGFQETKDGGKTWQMAAPLPPSFTLNRVGPHYTWDPRANIFYASGMTHPTFRFLRDK